MPAGVSLLIFIEPLPKLGKLCTCLNLLGECSDGLFNPICPTVDVFQVWQIAYAGGKRGEADPL